MSGRTSQPYRTSKNDSLTRGQPGVRVTAMTTMATSSTVLIAEMVALRTVRLRR